MRDVFASGLALALVAAPSAARADNPAGCLIGPSDLDRCSVSGETAGILAAILAPAMIGGAAVTIAHELRHHTDERIVPEKLTLIPEPPDPYREPPNAAPKAKETRPKPSAAFRFNDTATNVATAVTGAMVVGAIVSEIVKDVHGGGGTHK
jgi:hypothetical protein